jgi:hypothetical protein
MAGVFSPDFPWIPASSAPSTTVVEAGASGNIQVSRAGDTFTVETTLRPTAVAPGASGYVSVTPSTDATTGAVTFRVDTPLRPVAATAGASGKIAVTPAADPVTGTVTYSVDTPLRDVTVNTNGRLLVFGSTEANGDRNYTIGSSFGPSEVTAGPSGVVTVTSAPIDGQMPTGYTYTVDVAPTTLASPPGGAINVWQTGPTAWSVDMAPGTEVLPTEVAAGSDRVTVTPTVTVTSKVYTIDVPAGSGSTTNVVAGPSGNVQVTNDGAGTFTVDLRPDADVMPTSVIASNSGRVVVEPGVIGVTKTFLVDAPGVREIPDNFGWMFTVQSYLGDPSAGELTIGSGSLSGSTIVTLGGPPSDVWGDGIGGSGSLTLDFGAAMNALSLRLQADEYHMVLWDRTDVGTPTGNRPMAIGRLQWSGTSYNSDTGRVAFVWNYVSGTATAFAVGTELEVRFVRGALNTPTAGDSAPFGITYFVGNPTDTQGDDFGYPFSDSSNAVALNNDKWRVRVLRERPWVELCNLSVDGYTWFKRSSGLVWMWQAGMPTGFHVRVQLQMDNYGISAPESISSQATWADALAYFASRPIDHAAAGVMWDMVTQTCTVFLIAEPVGTATGRPFPMGILCLAKLRSDALEPPFMGQSSVPLCVNFASVYV